MSKTNKSKKKENTKPDINEDGYAKVEVMLNGDIRKYDEKGQFHNDKGPATITCDGTATWYIHGRKHRLDGPAIEGRYGYHEYWVDGSQIYWKEAHPAAVKEFLRKQKLSKTNK